MEQLVLLGLDLLQHRLSVSHPRKVFGNDVLNTKFRSFPFTGTSGESALNFGGLNVGSSTTTTGSIFGGGSVFGSPASGTNANPFGKTEKAAFGGKI